MIFEAFNGQAVAAILDHLHLDSCEWESMICNITYNGVIERVFVLLQPSGQVVGDGGGIVDDGKVRVGIRSRVWLRKLSPLAQQVVHQLLTKGRVSGFWEQGFLLKDGKEGHGLLKHVDTLLQIHPKVNVRPVQSLSDILLLLEGEPEISKLGDHICSSSVKTHMC